MIKNIFFFINSPFTERDYNRFGIKTLESNGFNIEIWDFTPFLCPWVYEVFGNNDPASLSKCRIFKKYDDVLNAISDLGCEQNFIINLVPYGVNTYRIYRAISRNNLKYGIFLANAMPLTVCSSYHMRDVLKKISIK